MYFSGLKNLLAEVSNATEYDVVKMIKGGIYIVSESNKSTFLKVIVTSNVCLRISLINVIIECVLSTASSYLNE